MPLTASSIEITGRLPKQWDGSRIVSAFQEKQTETPSPLTHFHMNYSLDRT